MLYSSYDLSKSMKENKVNIKAIYFIKRRVKTNFKVLKYTKTYIINDTRYEM